MRIRDWSSDVCSSDLLDPGIFVRLQTQLGERLFDVGVALCIAYGVGHAATVSDQHGSTTMVLRLRRGASPDAARCACQDQNRRAWCRERVCQCVWISVVRVASKKK